MGGHDYSSLRMVVELTSPARIPRELHITAPNGEGSIARITVLYVWQREEQEDVNGNYIPFFGPPPPPPPAPPPAFLWAGPACSARPTSSTRSTAGPTRGSPAHPPATAPDPHHRQHATRQPRPLSASTTAITGCDGASGSPDTPTPCTSRGTKEGFKSARLADKERAEYISMTDKAVQLTALKNALEPCSRKLKEQVQKSGLLTGLGKPIAISTLRKIANATGLGCAAEKSIATVAAAKE
nr:unnamed protein product [Digitaria exilis]